VRPDGFVNREWGTWLTLSPLRAVVKGGRRNAPPLGQIKPAPPKLPRSPRPEADWCRTPERDVLRDTAVSGSPRKAKG